METEKLKNLLNKFYTMQTSEDEEWELYNVFLSGSYDVGFIFDAENFLRYSLIK